MKEQRSTAGSLTAVLIMSIPLLYVGSYFALVTPQGTPRSMTTLIQGEYQQHWVLSDYRFAGRYLRIVYWPINQVDRRLRPESWMLQLGSRKYRQKHPPLHDKSLDWFYLEKHPYLNY